MGNQSWFEKFKERNVGRTLAVYLGSAWVFIEAFNFLIDKFNWNAEALDVIILLVIFGLPASVIYVWFDQVFTKRAIILQLINAIFALSIITFTVVKPDRINPTQLRLIKFQDNQKKLAESIRSIAILPFSNFTGNEDVEFLASGMQDALISDLGTIGAIRVVPRTSTLKYADSQMSIKEIAAELNVDAVLEASMLDASDNVLVQLKLVSAYPDEQQIWSKKYNSDMSNILNLYNTVIKNIANEINLTLSPEQEAQLQPQRKVNPEAYRAYLRGMYNLNMLTPESIEKGLEFLNEAIRIDPGEAFGYAGLALGYLEIAHSPLDPGDALDKAEAAALQAIKLDSTMAEIYIAIGELYLYKTWKFDKAEQCLLKAIELKPNADLAHYHYSWALYLFGDMEKAIEEHILAKKYDPFNPLNIAWLGSLYCFDGQYEKALQECKEADEVQENYPPTYYTLGMTYLEQGKIDEAIVAHKKLIDVFPPWTFSLGYTYARIGNIEGAEEILAELEKREINPWNAFSLAVMYTALEDFDKAFQWINWEPHHAFTAWVAVMPEFYKLHDDPRFKEFLVRLNLPE